MIGVRLLMAITIANGFFLLFELALNVFGSLFG